MEVMRDEAMILWQFDMIYRKFVESKSGTQTRERQQASTFSAHNNKDDNDDGDDSHDGESSEATILLSDNEHMSEGPWQNNVQNLSDKLSDETDGEDDTGALNQSGFVRSRHSIQRAETDTLKERLSNKNQSRLRQHSKGMKTSCDSRLQLSQTRELEPNSLQHLEEKDIANIKTVLDSKPGLAMKGGRQLKLTKHDNSYNRNCIKEGCKSRSEMNEILQHSKDNTLIKTACSKPRSRLKLKKRRQLTITQCYKEDSNLHRCSSSEMIPYQADSIEGLELADSYEHDSGVSSASSLQNITEAVSSHGRLGGSMDNEGKGHSSLSEHTVEVVVSPVALLDSTPPLQEAQNSDIGTKEGDVDDEGNVSDADSVHSNASGYCVTRCPPTSNRFTNHEVVALGLKTRRHRRCSRGRFYRRLKHRAQYKNTRKPSSSHEYSSPYDPSPKQQRAPGRTSRDSEVSTSSLRSRSTPKERRKRGGKNAGSVKKSEMRSTGRYGKNKSEKKNTTCETAVFSVKATGKQNGYNPAVTGRRNSCKEVEQLEQSSSTRQTLRRYPRNCKKIDMADSVYSKEKAEKVRETRLSKQIAENECSKEKDLLPQAHIKRRTVSCEKEERRQLNRACKAKQLKTSRLGKKPEKFDSEKDPGKQESEKKQANKEKSYQDRTSVPIRSGASVGQREKRDSRHRLPGKRKSSEDILGCKGRRHPRKSPRYNKNHGHRLTSRADMSPILGLCTDNNHSADVSINADDPLHRLSSMETVASTIGLEDMEQLMPGSALDSAKRLVFASETSRNLLTVQTIPLTLGQGSLFGPPRHIGAVWKSIMAEK